ncbi:hypothetical protein AWJ20_3336 [Sugiyamaella lignohabitans]|uniref:Uncharacterized protein n=1 Tax=Sugiyamaella lignohabitans TaxID=796027 RepID=A0A161HNH7_9ASCO|nr:uncharacterized protein AWJ20_3336 [Sugiyamaella lignohabitans]ANB15697.1 hypothetical protein AWJ20_3336 [Sugiyamaella lignohabitans]
MSKTGRIAVLLNIHEENDSDASRNPVSRGLFAKDFLSSGTDVSTKHWIEKTTETYGEEGLKRAGGFTLFCGRVETDPECKRILHEPFGLFSNRGDKASWVLSSAPEVAREHLEHALDREHGICVVSNGTDQTWEKLEIGRRLLKQLIDNQDNYDDNDLIEQLFAILSHDTYPLEEPTVYNLRKSIFIPTAKELYNGIYGTRTQTVVLIDTHGNVKYIEKNLGKDGFMSTFDFKLKEK